MTDENTTEKIYCYVDETGQDTHGELFIVVAIVLKEEREQLEKSLNVIEQSITKRTIKWNKLSRKEKQKYITEVLLLRELRRKIFVRSFKNSKSYEDLTTLTITQAINCYVKRENIQNYKATIIIDGLGKTEESRVRAAVRALGITTRKIKGKRDESSSLLRLADMFAGFNRECIESREHYKDLQDEASRKVYIKV